MERIQSEILKVILKGISKVPKKDEISPRITANIATKIPLRILPEIHLRTPPGISPSEFPFGVLQEFMLIFPRNSWQFRLRLLQKFSRDFYSEFVQKFHVEFFPLSAPPGNNIGFIQELLLGFPHKLILGFFKQYLLRLLQQFLRRFLQELTGKFVSGIFVGFLQ